MQPQGHVQIVVNLIDFGMNLQEAGDAPRARHEGSSEPTDEVMRDGGEVVLEAGFSADAVKALQARGHKVTVANDGDFGGYQAIMRMPKAVLFRRLRVAQGRRGAGLLIDAIRGTDRRRRGYSPALAPVVRAARALFTDCECPRIPGGFRAAGARKPVATETGKTLGRRGAVSWQPEPALAPQSAAR